MTQNPNPSSFLFLLNCELSITLGGLGTRQQLHDLAKLEIKIKMVSWKNQSTI